jgi:hypothetical protein
MMISATLPGYQTTLTDTLSTSNGILIRSMWCCTARLAAPSPAAVVNRAHTRGEAIGRSVLLMWQSFVVRPSERDVGTDRTRRPAAVAVRCLVLEAVPFTPPTAAAARLDAAGLLRWALVPGTNVPGLFTLPTHPACN